MIAGLSLLAFFEDACFLQGAGVMAEKSQRDANGVSYVFAGAFLALGQEFHYLQAGRVAQGFKYFGALRQVKLAHATSLPLCRGIGKLNT